MQISVPGRLLKSMVKSAVSVAKPADDRQILRNILLEATPEGLEVTATDTITGLWLTAPVSDSVVVTKPGRVVVNAVNFQRTIDTIAHRDVVIRATERSCMVEAGGSKFRLCIEDANDFPKVARFSSRKPYITIKADLLPKMIVRTAYCAHDEASFQLMHGMLVQAANNEIRMVATNGQRLAVSTLPFSEQSTEAEINTKVVIPAAAADAIKRIIDGEVESVDLQWMSNFFNVRTSLGEVSIRALAGNYPMYQRGIPSGLGTMTLDRRGLVEVLKQTTAIKSPTTNFVALEFKEDRMIFSSYAEGAGDAEVEYEFDRKGQPDEKITINPDFMIETLKFARGDDVSFETGNEMTPTILREQDSPEGLRSFCVYAVVRQ